MSTSSNDARDLLSGLDHTQRQWVVTLLQLQGAGLVTQHYVVTNLPFDLPCPDNCEGHPRGTP